MKCLINLFLRLFSFVIIFFTIMFFIDKIVYLLSDDIKWIPENNKIIIMNHDKLQNNSWDKNTILFKYKDEGRLSSKGNKKRILIIGDSLIWGYGYSNLNHVWWKQLERILHENGYNDVELVAAGTYGYNTEQQVNNILKNDELIEEVDPDLIILSYLGNDLEIYDEDGNDLFPVYDNNDFYADSKNVIINLTKNLFPSIYKKVSNQLSIKYTKNNKGFVNYSKWTDQFINEPWKTMYEERALEPLKEFIDNTDIPLFTFPIMSFPSYSDNYEYIINEWQKYNIPYYDSADDFIENFSNYVNKNFGNEWKINPADGHPSVKVTNFYGNWLYNLLVEKYPNIIGKKYDVSSLSFEINDWTPYMLKPTLVDENTYEFQYPKEKGIYNSFLYLPISEKYVKLNLKFPINIKSIEITSKYDDIESIEIWTNSINKELGYDDQVMKSLGKKKDKFIWNLNDNDLITSINISAKIKNGNSRKLTLKIEK